ncbi:cysteine methyltransferase [Mannheimia granulomatis]|uniref:Methylated-DNA--protein-cysteine methyltransferase n=1 Tax=Mannheimia granulomatis TaxID=85402 RepID=A0A011MI08_9PAST|nr:methylated-DNA--[protein]-cysteine S-methyltransferase [Mannheimia granulomatis]EXI62111.1 methylated-DNA--protein-cysteine methyltransferase [Mannheimia granulomatis]QLB14530.1 cysteine methyltransferase [Mannheimia granulomatis]RGE48676.1 methylated-DNA--protein-cysteine methyltransferase [Mannheimia granulomatis]
MTSQIYYDYYQSPVGRLLLLAQTEGLIYIEFEQEQQTTLLQNFIKASATSGAILEIFCKTHEILDRYFAGEKLNFSQLDFLHFIGTDFQKSVWTILRTIPYGQTTTYGEIAAQLGKPNAMRAVGGAVGRNPISILVPCHRVLGRNQSLTGFGGGLPNKRFLLKLEGISYKNQGIEFVKPKTKKW